VKTGIKPALVATLAVLQVFVLTSCDQAPSAQRRNFEQQYWVEEYLTGLNRPRALAWLSDGEALLALWDGSVKVLKQGKVIGEVTGVPKVFKSWYMGLRDMKLDPDFASNHLVYLSYASGDLTPEELRTSGKVWRARLDGHSLVDGKEIFDSITPNGFVIMGPLLFLPDKTLLVPVGSLAQSEIGLVQRRDNHMGKLIRINRDGSVPTDNPLLNDPTALPEIYALGLRNPSGIVRTDDGRIWLTDIGPKAGDELNLLEPGANYGWPLVTWGFDYSGESMVQLTGSPWQEKKPEMTDPVLVWVPSQVPSSLMQYHGTAFPFWDGDVFTGGLASLTLRRMRIRDGSVVLQEAMLTDLKERLRTVEQGPDGFIYVLTDSYGSGRILRLRPGNPPAGAHVAKVLEVKNEEDRFGQDETPEAFDQIRSRRGDKIDPAQAEDAFMQNCSSCHSFGKFKTGRIGPELNGLVGRKSGTLPGFSYTPALKDPEHQVVWSYLTLFSFLSNPQKYFPGTAMAIPPLTARDRASIVDYVTGGALTKLNEASDERREEETRSEKK
jgi:glucose/arabinose dehydrogenase/cytochrome c2